MHIIHYAHWIDHILILQTDKCHRSVLVQISHLRNLEPSTSRNRSVVLTLAGTFTSLMSLTIYLRASVGSSDVPLPLYLIRIAVVSSNFIFYR